MTIPTKKTKMSDLINYRLKVSLIDGRFFLGSLLAFDKHMNLVLGECYELRLSQKSIQNLTSSNLKQNLSPDFEKRALGLVILRGEQVASLSVESAPLPDPSSRIKTNSSFNKGTTRPLKTPKSIIKKLSGPTLK